jgi:hypothetical protein
LLYAYYSIKIKIIAIQVKKEIPGKAVFLPPFSGYF